MKSTITKVIIMMAKTTIKILLVLFLSLNLAVASNVNGQIKSIKEVSISINLANATLKSVFHEIEKKTDYRFSYSKERVDLSQRLDISFKDESVESILMEISKLARLKFRQVNNNIGVQVLTGSETTSRIEVEIVEFKLTGTIVDDEGSPLPGATILVKSTQQGTVTDVDGNFSINVNEGDVLIVSFVGYKTQEVTVGSVQTIRISMETDYSSLDEVVVLGYGTAERKEVTSAVVSVDDEDFNRGNINDPVQLLQGKVAGLSIARPGGDPNGGYTIRLRGLSTFGANSQPLIVIDGVLGGSLQLIDPNDIASIEVLKDASAAAIYGSRGASGVIIVTTKGAQRGGAPRVEFNSYAALEEIAHSVETATREQYIEAGGIDQGYDTDWLDEVTRSGVNHVYNLSISSSLGSGSYRASINSRNVEGIAVGSGFNQLNARLGITQRAINDKLTLDLNFGVNKRKVSFVPYQGMRYAIIADPTAPIYNGGDPSQGYWEPTATPEYQNPVGIINEVTDDGVFKRQLASARLEYEIVEGLSLAGFYSIQSDSDMRSEYYSSKTRFTSEPGGRAEKFSEFRDNELFEVTGTFKKAITNDISINAVAGYSWQKFQLENFSAFNSNFVTDDLLYNALELGLGSSSGNPQFAGSFSQKEESLLISYFARAIFNIKDAYFLSGTIRREGSSKFGANNRWGNFYAVSGGADIAQIVSIPNVNVLKARVGYGVTGNLPNENYEYLVRLGFIPSERIEYLDRNLQTINFASNPNPNLKWEQKAEANFGLDFGLLTNRLTGSIDYYVRNTSDVLRRVAVAQPPNFFDNTLLNIGELKSNGLEVALNYLAVESSDLDITTGLIYATNTTKVVVIDGDTEAYNTANLGPPGLNNTLVIRVAEGEEIGQIMAPTYLGLNEDGTRNVVDINDDGTIDQDNDAVVAGKGLPDFELSWNTSVRWKNFDLSMVWRGVFGHDLVNINRAYYESPSQSGTGNIVRTKYYLPELTEAEDWNDYYVEDADFVKLDNISIGYSPTFKTDVIKNLRIYVTIQNPIVITDYTGVDPEVHYAYGGDNLAPGIDDRNSYYRTRTYSIGFNIGF